MVFLKQDPQRKGSAQFTNKVEWITWWRVFKLKREAKGLPVVHESFSLGLMRR
jgi:hypothetical protein